MRNITRIHAIIFRKFNDSYEFLVLKRADRDYWQPLIGIKPEDEREKDFCLSLSGQIGIKAGDILQIFYTGYKSQQQMLDQNKQPAIITEFVFGIEVQPWVKLNLGGSYESSRWYKYRDAVDILANNTHKEGLRKLNAAL